MVSRALGSFHRLSSVRQGRSRLACDLAAKDVIDVQDTQRCQLLRPTGEFDHAVKLGFAIAKMPRQAQHDGASTREDQAEARRWVPESIRAEINLSLTKPKRLLCGGKALIEPRSKKVCRRQAGPDGCL
jgi:hypothetical protein